MANTFLIIYRSAHLMVTRVTCTVTAEKKKMFRMPILQKSEPAERREQFPAEDDRS